ncbi:transcriptional repressor [Marivivens donghaensis]|uniref:Transcriptional repressor n=1 Tax=Marivivens donghaensis TaxID=1699413 RepID=A0ABX0VWD4_9RHOB|nr:Fur family transcriptional regulator [Marivivens donghaensis]NIY72389.1 transcriptional repressor [Marivivens donghaensis]
MTEQISGFVPHDHHHCITSALDTAADQCRERGVQFTPVRKRVLEILLEAHTAMGAYDVLARLDAEGLGSKPPVAYRALSFLVEQGFAHRIEKLNAFVACSHPAATHSPAFMICRSCNTVAEADMPETFGAPAEQAGFTIEKTVIEAEGICQNCKDSE